MNANILLKLFEVGTSRWVIKCIDNASLISIRFSPEKRKFTFKTNLCDLKMGRRRKPWKEIVNLFFIAGQEMPETLNPLHLRFPFFLNFASFMQQRNLNSGLMLRTRWRAEWARERVVCFRRFSFSTKSSFNRSFAYGLTECFDNIKTKNVGRVF